MIVMDGFGWSGGSGWVMGQWSVGQWMVGVMSYQKKYGLNSTKCHKVEKISGSMGVRWVWWVWWVMVGDGSVVGGSVNSGFHELSEKCHTVKKYQVGWVLSGFGGSGGSGWVMGQWSVGRWMVGDISFQKIYGLYGLSHVIKMKR